MTSELDDATHQEM